MSTSKTFVLPDSRPLSYALSSAPAEAPIVILSNSLCANFASWDRVVGVLESKGYRTLRYDQPGHGASGVPADLGSTSFASMADDVRHLLRHLGLSSVYAWVGVSMGAATGIYFVTRHPGVVSKLVVCDTITSSPANAGVADAFGPRVEAARAAGNMDQITEQTLERWFGAEWLAAQPEEAVRMRVLMRTTSIDGFETCCAALRSKDFDLRPLLGKVALGCDDVLFVVGEKDANLPSTMHDMRRAVEEGFREAGKAKALVMKILKNAGHVCYVDGFAEFCEVVTEFLHTEQFSESEESD